MKYYKRWILQQCERCNDNFHRACIEKIIGKSKAKNNKMCQNCLTTTTSTTPPTNQQQTNPQFINLRKGVKLAHINVRSLFTLNKFDEIKILLLQYQLDVLIIGETWLYDKIDDIEVNIPGYHLIRRDRTGATKSNAGGGVLCYIQEDWDYEEIPSPFKDPVEAICFKIKKLHHANLTIAGLYRPESGSLQFRKMIESFLDSAPPNTYIVGDMNVDVSSSSSNAKILKSLLLQHNFSQLIQTATRITNKSKTLIDLIITNSPDKQVQSGVITTGIADHELIFTVRAKVKEHKSAGKVINVRSIKKINHDLINQFIDSGPWWCFELNKNVDKCFEICNSIIKIAFDKFSPTKTVRVKANPPKWLTSDIKKLLKQRDDAKTTAKQSKSQDDWDNYTKLRNECVKNVKILKAKQIVQIIENSNNPSKTHWKMFNSEIGKKQKTASIKTIINEQNNLQLTDNLEMSNYFCDIYSSSSKSISSSNTQSPNDFTHPNWIPVADCEKLTDFKFSLRDIQSTIKKLKNYKAAGVDGLKPEMLKIISPSISPILTYLFNLSSSSGMYPQCLKETLITPIYKNKGPKNQADSFRPISVVSVIAKTYENLLCRQIVKHLKKNKLLSPHQHGFRDNYSTTSATIKLTTDIYNAMDKRKYTGAYFIDFRSAFCKVVHVLLIRKLKQMGVQGNALKLLESYLNNRKIRVKVNGVISKQGELKVGTPQGSGISGILFAIFINDLPQCLKKSFIIAYADDVIIYYSSQSVKEINDAINDDMQAIQDWAKKNSMEINWNKTKTMIFYSNNMVKPTEFSTTIQNHDVEIVNNFTYLGLILDNRLSWDEQFNHTCKTVSSRIQLISRHKSSFTQDKLLIYAKSLIISVIDYCIPVWGNVCDTNISKLDNLLDRMIRNILSFKTNTTSHDRVEICNVLYTEERKILYGLNFLFKHIINTTDVTSEFNQYYSIIESTTRSNGDLDFKYPKTSIGKKSFFYWAPKYYNNLQSNVKEIRNPELFDKEIRQVLLKKRKCDFVYQSITL
jgi:hypothetical protein